MREFRMGHDSAGFSHKQTAEGTDVNGNQSDPISASESVQGDRDEVSAFIERKIKHLREAHLSKLITAAGLTLILIGGLSFVNNLAAIILPNYHIYLDPSLWSIFLLSVGAAEAYRQGSVFSPTLDVMALVLTIIAALVFVSLGVLTIRRRVWSSVAAFILYGIDTFFLLPFSPKSAAIHVILMYIIYKGIKATKRYRALVAESETT